MDIIAGLQSKDDREAYRLLLLLEQRSEESDELYGCLEDFLGLLHSKSAFVRVRGFRLACAQARWDAEDRLERHLDALLTMLDDPKPTAVRQCLAALGPVILHKPGLRGRIAVKLDGMDLSKYKDSMRPLIGRDIQALREQMRSPGPSGGLPHGWT